MTDQTPAVYAAINGVMDELSAEGISKTGRNKDQGYNFRGIDAVYGALCRKLVKNKLLMLPRALSHRHDIRQTKSGTNMYVAIMEIAFDLVAVADGSMHTIVAWGEAADSADKSTNKAMSAALKYAAIQAFCIPVEGVEDDADEVTPENTVPRASGAYTQSLKSIRGISDNERLGAWWTEQKAGIKPMVTEAEYADLIAAVKDQRDSNAQPKNDNPFEEAA